MPTPMRWRRKLEREGDYWAQAPDGSWARWDPVASDWAAAQTGPPGGAPPLQPEGPEPFAPPVIERDSAMTVAKDVVVTFGGLILPGAIAAAVAFGFIWPISIIWNGLFVPWLGTEMQVLPTMVFMFGGILAVTVFLTIALVILHHGDGGNALFLAVVASVGGPLLVLAVAARALGVSIGDLLARSETAAATFLVLAGYGVAAYFRSRSEE